MRIKSILVFTCMAFSGIAAAQYTGNPAATQPAYGYTGPGAQAITTVAAARQAPDDSMVTLEGYITRRINNDDLYEFKDKTGTITVDIDHKKWPGQVTDKTKVRLYGEVDKNLVSVEIDVDRVEIVAPQ